MLNTLVMQFDDLLTKYEGVLQKIKTIGDAYWCVCGLPDTVESPADYTCHFAHGMFSAVRAANLASFVLAATVLASVALELRRVVGVAGGSCRGGMHTGDIVAAVMGSVRLTFDVFGDAINTCSRVMSTADPNELAVSDTFYETFSRNEQQHVSFAFSSPLERAAKGKKALVVRALQECKAVVSP